MCVYVCLSVTEKKRNEEEVHNIIVLVHFVSLPFYFTFVFIISTCDLCIYVHIVEKSMSCCYHFNIWFVFVIPNKPKRDRRELMSKTMLRREATEKKRRMRVACLLFVCRSVPKRILQIAVIYVV